MNKRLKNCSFLIVIHILLLASCEKIEIDNTDKDLPIELRLSGDGSSIVHLDWTKTEITSFESYILMRSSEPDLLELQEPTSIASAIEIVQIKNFERHTYEDLPAVQSDAVYYKVFVDIGNRFLASNVVSTSPRVVQLPFTDYHSHTNFSPRKDYLFFIEPSAGTSKTWRVNYKSGQASEVSNILPNGSDEYFLNVNQNASADHLFVLDNDNMNLEWYNLSNSNFIQNFNTSVQTYSVDVSKNGIVFAAMDDFFNPIHIYKSSSTVPIKKFTSSSHSSNKQVACISASENEFIEADNLGIRRYKVDNAGNLLSLEESDLHILSTAKKIEVSPDYQYFIPYVDGFIYDKNLSIIGRIRPDNAGFFTDYAFSEDGKSLYAVNGFEVYEFSFPELVKRRKIIAEYSPRDVFVDDNTLILVARLWDNVLGTSNMMYQTFDISE